MWGVGNQAKFMAGVRCVEGAQPIIDAMGVAGTAHEVREQLRRYNGVLDHIMLYSPSVGITAERVQQNLDSIIRECSPASMSPGRSCPRST